MIPRITILRASVLAAVLVLAGPLHALFSDYGFARNPEREDNSLQVEMTGWAALRSYRFLEQVGGVNFETAIDLTGTGFDLDYNASAPDGQRVRLMIGGTGYTLPLFDWELLPTVNYSDSKYTAAVSIFGEGPQPKDYYYINYHPALEDTHLGARLLQADILLMDPMAFSEAPTERGRKVYLPGEAAEAGIAVRRLAAVKLSGILSQGDFQSWVLTDTNETPQLRLAAGKARVDLQPYYYFWTVDESPEAVQSRRDAERMVIEHNTLRDKASPLIEAYNAAVTTYNSAPTGSSRERLARSKLDALEAELAPITERLSALRDKLESRREPEVAAASNLIQAVKSATNILDRAAPFVTSAVRKAAGYAALFRGARRADPAKWSVFRDRVRREVKLAPVETPNQFRRPNSAAR